MSFQDLLNRPLPSKDVYTEAQLDDNISEDIAELSRTYKKSIKTIKEKINIIRIGIRTNKFNAALNSIIKKSLIPIVVILKNKLNILNRKD